MTRATGTGKVLAALPLRILRNSPLVSGQFAKKGLTNLQVDLVQPYLLARQLPQHIPWRSRLPRR